MSRSSDAAGFAALTAIRDGEWDAYLPQLWAAITARRKIVAKQIVSQVEVRPKAEPTCYRAPMGFMVHGPGCACPEPIH